jgi:hypothetical protein
MGKHCPGITRGCPNTLSELRVVFPVFPGLGCTALPRASLVPTTSALGYTAPHRTAPPPPHLGPPACARARCTTLGGLPATALRGRALAVRRPSLVGPAVEALVLVTDRWGHDLDAEQGPEGGVGDGAGPAPALAPARWLCALLNALHGAPVVACTVLSRVLAWVIALGRVERGWE